MGSLALRRGVFHRRRPVPGVRVRVGSFVKTTAAATVRQFVPVGFEAKALILWSNHVTSEGAFAGGLGTTVAFVTSGAARSACDASSDGVSTSVARGRLAAKAWQRMNAAGTVLVEATLSDVTSKGFELEFTTNDSDASVIYFLAIGGDDVEANVHQIATPTSTGNQAITDPGFRPDVVFLLGGGLNAGALGTPSTDARLGLGAFDAAGNQWATAAWACHNLSPADSERALVSSACLLTPSGFPAHTPAAVAAFVSMDATGYTINWSTAFGASGKVFGLAIKGGRWTVGATTKPTGSAPAGQVLVPDRGVVGALLASVMGPASASIVDHYGFALGALDGDRNAGATARIDRDAANPTIAKAYSAAKAALVVNNGTPALDAAAEGRGASIQWTPNDATATAFGFAVVAV